MQCQNWDSAAEEILCWYGCWWWPLRLIDRESFLWEILTSFLDKEVVRSPYSPAGRAEWPLPGHPPPAGCSPPGDPAKRSLNFWLSHFSLSFFTFTAGCLVNRVHHQRILPKTQLKINLFFTQPNAGVTTATYKRYYWWCWCQCLACFCKRIPQSLASTPIGSVLESVGQV